MLAAFVWDVGHSVQIQDIWTTGAYGHHYGDNYKPNSILVHHLLTIVW